MAFHQPITEINERFYIDPEHSEHDTEIEYESLIYIQNPLDFNDPLQLFLGKAPLKIKDSKIRYPGNLLQEPSLFRLSLGPIEISSADLKRSNFGKSLLETYKAKNRAYANFLRRTQALDRTDI